MSRPSNRAVQTPGVDPVNDDDSLGTTPDPMANADSLREPAALENPAEGSLEARVAQLEARNAQLLQTTADLQALVRKTVETGVAPTPVKLPTVEEALKAGHTIPVLTEQGYLVPDSEKWAVSAGDRSRK